MQPVLAIDTCGAAGYVALLDADTSHVLAETVLPARETQERLMPAVAEVLASAGCIAQELHTLAVVAGPGSFTGVRIGLATVKGLAEALAIPVASFSRLQVLLTAGRQTQPEEARLHAWLEAGRGDVYSAAADGGAERITAFEAASLAVQPGDVVVVLESSLQARSAKPVLLLTDEQYRRAFCHLAATAVQNEQFQDAVLLDAHYLRLPDAEIALRARMVQTSSTKA